MEILKKIAVGAVLITLGAGALMGWVLLWMHVTHGDFWAFVLIPSPLMLAISYFVGDVYLECFRRHKSSTSL